MTVSGGDGEKAWIATVLAKLDACGVAAFQTNIQYQDDIQDYDIVLSELDIAAVQFDGLARLCVEDSLIFTFAQSEAQDLFYEACKPIAHAKESIVRAQSHAVLDAYNLLEGLPVFDPTAQTLSDYAQAVEVHCGFPAGSMLQARGEKLLSFQSMDALLRAGNDRSFLLSQAILASNLTECGVRFAVLAKSI